MAPRIRSTVSDSPDWPEADGFTPDYSAEQRVDDATWRIELSRAG